MSRLFIILFLYISCGTDEHEALSKGSKSNENSVVIEEFISWAKQYSSTTTPISSFGGQTNSGDERCYFGTVDSQYVYCAGHTDNHFITENAGGTDIFVIKYNRVTGEEVANFQLGKDAESSSHIIELSGNENLGGIEVDSSGNIYLVGHTRSNLAENLAMYSGVDYDPLSYPAQNQDIFIVKLDSSMNIVWAKQFGDTTTVSTDPSCVCDNSMAETVYATAIDPSGNIYLGGSSASDLYRDNPYSSRLASGAPAPFIDMFALKINPNGEVQWVYHVGESSPKSHESLKGLVVHGSELYFTAQTDGNWIDPGEQTGTGTSDLVLGKLNLSDGSQTLLNQIGATENTNHAFIVDTQYSEQPTGKFGVDSAGNFYVTGAARGPFAQSDANPSTSIFDPFVLKADSNGVPIAAIQFAGSNVAFPANPEVSTLLIRNLVLDSNNNSYTLLTTKSSQFTNVSPGSAYDSFVIKLDSDLNPIGENLGFYQFSGDNLLENGESAHDDSFLNIVIDELDRFYIMGSTTSNYVEARTGSNDAIIFKSNL